MIIFLQISKYSALFKIRKYQNILFSLSLSLAHWHPDPTRQWHITEHDGAAITGRPKMRRRWRSGEADRTQMIYTLLQTHPSPQIGRRRTGEDSTPAMAAWARRLTA